MDGFHKERVSNPKHVLSSLKNILSYVAGVALSSIAVTLIKKVIDEIFFNGFSGNLLFSVVLALLTGSAAVFFLLNASKSKAEYEYTFSNGRMTFSRVISDKRQKELGNLDLRIVEACGMVTGSSFNRYNSIPGIKRFRFFSDRNAELLYFYINKKNPKQIVIIEPSEEMVGLIKKYIGEGVWQND